MINVCKYRDGLWPVVSAASDETGADVDIGVDFTRDEIYCAVRRPSDGGDEYDNSIVPRLAWEDAVAAREWMVAFVKSGAFRQKKDGRSVTVDRVCALHDALLPELKGAASPDVELDIWIDFKKHELQVKAWCFSKRCGATRPINVTAIQNGDHHMAVLVGELRAEIAAKEIAA